MPHPYLSPCIGHLLYVRVRTGCGVKRVAQMPPPSRLQGGTHSGAWVQPLIRELGSHMLRSMAKKKNQQICGRKGEGERGKEGRREDGHCPPRAGGSSKSGVQQLQPSGRLSVTLVSKVLKCRAPFPSPQGGLSRTGAASDCRRTSRMPSPTPWYRPT